MLNYKIASIEFWGTVQSGKLTAAAKAGFVAVGVIEEIAVVGVINDIGIAGGGCFIAGDCGKLFGEVGFGVQFGELVLGEIDFVGVAGDEVGYGIVYSTLTGFAVGSVGEDVVGFVTWEGVAATDEGVFDVVASGLDFVLAEGLDNFVARDVIHGFDKAFAGFVGFVVGKEVFDGEVSVVGFAVLVDIDN